MQRSEYRRLFIAQGSSPLDVLRVLGQVYPRIEYDRGCRNNVLVVAGDLHQARVQLPKDDPHIRGPLSTHNFLMMQCALTNFDFTCELELVVSLSVSLFSAGTNTLLVPPATKKVSIKVSMSTCQGIQGAQNTTNDGTGKVSSKGYRSTPIKLGGQNSTRVAGGFIDSSVIQAPPCRIPLNGMIRGAWTFLVVDMGGLICEHVKTNSGFAEMLTPSTSRNQAQNTFKKPTQLHIDVMSLLLERVTICGSVRIRDVTTASDEQAVFKMNNDANLPVFVLPLTDLSDPPPLPVSQKHLLHAYPQSPKKDQRLNSTVLLPHQKHAISLDASPVGLQLKESIDSALSFTTPVKGMNVRFSKNGEGTVSFVAKDPEKDMRAAAKEKAKREAELQDEEFRRKEQEIFVALEQEALANRYTRLVEPVKEHQTDRFGVRLPDKQEKGLVSQIDITCTSNFEGWLDNSLEPATKCDIDNTNAMTKGAPLSKGLMGKQSGRRRPAARVPAAGGRIATPPLRFDYLTRKPTKASKRPPPKDTPAPSSLLLTSIMRKPLHEVHATDNIKLVACPIEGGRQTAQNIVLSHKDVGYGKGCLAVIHSTSSDDGESSYDTDESDCSIEE